jgi:hypothetical protein
MNQRLVGPARGFDDPQTTHANDRTIYSAAEN